MSFAFRNLSRTAKCQHKGCEETFTTVSPRRKFCDTHSESIQYKGRTLMPVESERASVAYQVDDPAPERSAMKNASTLGRSNVEEVHTNRGRRVLRAANLEELDNQ